MNFYGPISADPQHKAWIRSRSLAGIVGSNPAGGHGCLSLLSAVLSGRVLRDGPIHCAEM
jgi:hypothetical protein